MEAAPALLFAGTGISIDQDGRADAEGLLGPPRRGDDVDPQLQEQLRFSVQPVDGAIGYRWELGEDAAIYRQIAEIDTEMPEAVLAGVPDGSYFLRASAISSSGVQGLSATFGFDRVKTLVAGQRFVTRALDHGQRQFLFVWEGDSASNQTYRFSLARDPNAEVYLVDEIGLRSTQLRVNGLPDGVYYWRVEASRYVNRTLYKSDGEWRRIEIGVLADQVFDDSDR